MLVGWEFMINYHYYLSKTTSERYTKETIKVPPPSLRLLPLIFIIKKKIKLRTDGFWITTAGLTFGGGGGGGKRDIGMTLK